jgi:hypothetical protein
MVAATRTSSAWERYAWAAGILYVIALVAVSVVELLGGGLSQNASAAKIANTLYDHRGRLLVVTYLSVVYAAMFLIYAGCVIGAACPRVPGREGCPCSLAASANQRVINGAAHDAQAAQRVRLRGARAAQHKRGRAGIHRSRHAIQQLAAVGTEAAGPANG